MNATGERRIRGRRFALASLSLTRLLMAALLLAGPARGQDLVRFDPSRDLDGFDACFASEFRDLYPLDTYSEMLGREMSTAALAETRQRWRSDREGGDKNLAALRTDPREESLWLLRHRLAKSAYFSKIAWTEDRSFPGLVILVQRPSKKLPDYAANVAREHGPWLVKLSSLFEEQYAKPLNLERPRSRALWAIALLPSPGDYQKFWSIHPNPGPNSAWACYDQKLGLSVGYEDPFQPGVSSVERRYPILNAFARGMIDGYSISPEGRPGALWIEEGLASYLVYHEGTAPACLDERRIRPTMLQAIVDMAQSQEWGRLVLHPIEDLVSIKSSEDIDNLVTRRSEAAAKPRPAEKDVLNAFYGQSTLWVHFFHAAAGGAFREPFLKYLSWALSGEAGSRVLRLALDGKDTAAINREFLRWLAEEERRAFPEAKVDTARIDALFGDRGGHPPAGAADLVRRDKARRDGILVMDARSRK